MEAFQKIKFKDGSFEMDINLLQEDNSIWLSGDEIALFFNKDRTVISRHISSVIKNNTFDMSRVCAKFARTGTDGKTYKVDYYSIEVILAVAFKVKSNRGVLLRDYISNYLSQTNSEINEVVIYNNGNINLSVNISPEEDTVWLNVNQISTLFETTTSNIYMHINNIFKEGELSDSLGKDSLLTEQFTKKISSPGLDGKTYLIDYYNLDMILAVGYRVKSKKAIEFRRWASRVIKQYLLKGYALDADRVSISKENYIRLENDVANIKKEIKEIKEKAFIEPVKQRLFYNGQFFDAYEFITSLLLSANQSIIIIDPYFDLFALDYLKDIKQNIQKTIITSSNGWLPQKAINKFIKQYGEISIQRDDNFHDRFIILDEKKAYSIGASLNHAGKRTFAIINIEEEIMAFLLERIKRK